MFGSHSEQKQSPNSFDMIANQRKSITLNHIWLILILVGDWQEGAMEAFKR